MKPYIHEFILNRQRQRVGVVLAAPTPSGEVAVGWSLCKTNAGEKFNEERGIHIAYGRAVNYGGVDPIPTSVLKTASFMATRAKRYFKDKSVFGA
jgi:hypothetical protein